MLSPRIRATSYVTRNGPQGAQLLVFEYPTAEDTGTHLPGGGVEAGERVDVAAIREAVEETGVSGALALRGVVGVQQGVFHDTGKPWINVYFHLSTDEDRDAWSHVMIGDAGAWDTGLEVACRFVPLGDAAPLLRNNFHRQDEFLDLLGF